MAPGGSISSAACSARGRLMTITIDRIDHVVVNCRDVTASARWYERVLGMRAEAFGPDRRIALKFGSQKLNLRPTGPPHSPTATLDAPGSLDLFSITPLPPA